jgi:hypothetical protein
MADQPGTGFELVAITVVENCRALRGAEVTRMVIPLVMLTVERDGADRAGDVLNSPTAKTVGGRREAIRRGVIRWKTHRCTVTASKVLWTQSRDRGAWE